MHGQATFTPLVASKFLLWILTIIAATVLLRRRRMSFNVRLAFLIGGTLIFGFLYGALIARGPNPNPVAALRSLLKGLLVKHQLSALLVGPVLLLLLLSWLSNKSICGYACQLGLLQDLLHQIPLPKWRPPFWLSNTVRILAFVGLIAGLVLSGLDWIGLVDPFRLFRFNFDLLVGLTVGIVLLTSLFIYRPWCRFLCPFGLISWLVEQVSVWRVRLEPSTCKGCQLCVRACPTQAMADLYAGKKIRADCFACGACLSACPIEGGLAWRAWRKRSE